MRQSVSRHARVLAIDPSPKGFGYVVLEGADNLIDWGTKSTKRARNDICLKHLSNLFTQFCPNVFVIEDYKAASCRRGQRVKALLQEAEKLAVTKKVISCSINPLDAKKRGSLDSSVSKDILARKLTEQFPELEPFLPVQRKPWMSEDTKASIFDALALAITCFKQCT
jgi:hypothetical protein